MPEMAAVGGGLYGSPEIGWRREKKSRRVGGSQAGFQEPAPA